MTQHSVRIAGRSGEYQVTLDDIEISPNIRGLDLHIDHYRTRPRLTLDVCANHVDTGHVTADVEVSTATRTLLVALGWTPPAQAERPSEGFGLYVPIPIEHHPYDPECCPIRDEPGCNPQGKCSPGCSEAHTYQPGCELHQAAGDQ